MRTKFYGICLIAGMLALSACSKNKDQKPEEDKGPMTVPNGWELFRKSKTFHVYSNAVNTFELIEQHSDGFDIVYSSVFNFQQELNIHDVRWRTYNDGKEKVEKVVLHEIAAFDGLGRAILSVPLDLHSEGMGENSLYALGEYDSRSNVVSEPYFYRYDFFNVKPVKRSLKTFKFGFKNTQSARGLASADPVMPFACNGMNARILNNAQNIYRIGDYVNIIAAALKGDQLVCLAIRDSLLYVLESDPSQFTHSSGSYSETVNAVVIKNIYLLSDITGTQIQNFVDVWRSYSDGNYLNVFLGMRNGKHRYLRISLGNYSLSSINESLYEQISPDPLTLRDVVMLNDRNGELLSFESDGIYHLKANSKNFIASPEIKAGTVISKNLRYFNGYLWHLMFDSDGAYLIRKAI